MKNQFAAKTFYFIAQAPKRRKGFRSIFQRKNLQSWRKTLKSILIIFKAI